MDNFCKNICMPIVIPESRRVQALAWRTSHLSGIQAIFIVFLDSGYQVSLAASLSSTRFRDDSVFLSCDTLVYPRHFKILGLPRRYAPRKDSPTVIASEAWRSKNHMIGWSQPCKFRNNKPDLPV